MSGRVLTRSALHEDAPGRSFLCALLALFVSGGCAQIEAPRGGPADTEPPRVIATFPDSGAVQVPMVDSIAIVFSEPMDRASVESSFFLSPPVEYRERRWDKETWILRLSEPLREDQTYAGFVGTGIRDRQRLSPKAPWSFAFSTGDSLDTGAISGKVLGQRYPAGGALIFVWPWEAGLPDTAAEGFPEDPIRLGQANASGEYRLEYLPRNRPLQVCALFDRDQNRRFDPRRDRWGCLDEPLALSDTIQIRSSLDLFLTSPDEPGTVAGVLVDSSCVLAELPARIGRVRAKQDSLREWMEYVSIGEDSVVTARDSVEPMLDEEDSELEGRIRAGTPQADGSGPRAGWVRGPTREDSLRIEQERLLLDTEEVLLRSDSLWCAHPVAAHLIDQDSVLIRESYGSAGFRWSDVPPGVYRLLGFRDMNGNRQIDPGEPSVWHERPIEVRPLRVIDGLDLLLPSVLDAARRGKSLRDSLDRGREVLDHTDPGENQR